MRNRGNDQKIKIMKKIFTIAISLLFVGICNAQSAKDTIVSYQGMTIPASVITMSQDKDLVTDALLQRLKDSAVKVTKLNGYIVVQNQAFDAICNQPVDFFVRVSEQGRKSNKVTEVVCFSKSPNLTISQTDLNLNVKHFAENFYNYVARYEAQQKMKNEEKNLKVAQRNQVKAVAAVNSIDKDINSDQEKIAKKEAEILKYQQKIEELRAEIEQLQARVEKSQGKKSQAEEKVSKANDAVQSTSDEVERYRQQSQ